VLAQFSIVYQPETALMSFTFQQGQPRCIRRHCEGYRLAGYIDSC
jgi:hypothetical protein